MLTIVKVSFVRTLKWEFLLDGNRIGATINDRSFLDAIDNREKAFSKGDLLDVDLRIRQELDPDLGLFENRGYEVMAVHDHIQVPIQTILPFTEN